MILIDTSIWVSHFRKSDENLLQLLNDRKVLIHPMVIGELLLGALDHQTFHDMCKLPQAIVAGNNDVFDFILEHSLTHKGIGFVDAHLLVSAVLSNADLMTRDKSLADVANAIGSRV